MPVLKTKSWMVVSSLLIFSCADFRGKGEETPYESECGVCHGTPENPAPPPDVKGRSDTALRGVGAHASHLVNTELSQPVKCGDCHKVPASASDQGHLDTALPAEVVFSDFASGGGSSKPAVSEIEKPAKADGIEDNNEEEKEDKDYDLKTVKCSNVYCHGATLSGGSGTDPVWTAVDGTYKKCDSCHGFPPVQNHTTSKLCWQCHGTVVDADNKIIDRSLHIDGKISLTQPAVCNACHGSDKSPAPPPDLSGSLATSSKGVGAHENHLFALKGFRDPIECAECHAVPQSVDAEGHIDGTEGAEVAFGALARNDEANPQWDKTSLKCSNLYCHGGTLSGGQVTQPVWNLVDGSQVFCGSCHSLPPQPPHADDDNCVFCHAATVDKDKKIIGKDKHINGTVNISISAPCNYCHGSDDNFAPPVDLEGKSDTSLVSVGAHQSHIKALNAVSSGVACSECHKVPSDADYPAHLDGDKKAEVTFGTLAKKEGAAPEWTQNSTCKNVYCHGASLDGGSDKEPVWIKVDSSQVKCGSCHGYPPVANNHPQKTDCGICHDEIADNAGKIAKPEKHINGVLNVAYSGACDACHGSDENFAPPVDLDGKSDTSLVSVGAHQSHLKGLNKISSEVECGECHKVPLTAGESSHIDGDGKAEITFGSLAKKEDSSPQWTQNATCKNVYCHGASLEEGKNKEPLWTKVDSSQVKCDSCHGYPPSGDEHPPQTNCGMCHNGIADASGNILKPALHIDGEIEEPENLQCNSCHGSNDNDAPPKDVSGNTATSFKGVGAHQAHLKGSKYGTLVACGECHKVPAETFSGGHVDTPLPAEVAFGTIAKKDNPNAAWDGTKCSNVYCHGSAALGGVLTTPQWTKADGSQSGCGSCHSLPPPLPHLQMSACSDCHASVVKNNLEIIKNGKHINGQIDYN